MRHSLEGLSAPGAGRPTVSTATMVSAVSRSGTTPLGVTSMPSPDRAETLPEVPRLSPRAAMLLMASTSPWRRAASSLMASPSQWE